MSCRPPIIYSDSIQTVEDCLKYLDFDSAYYDPEHECYQYAVEYVAKKDNCELSFLIKSQDKTVEERQPTVTPIPTLALQTTPIITPVLVSKNVINITREVDFSKEFIGDSLQLETTSYNTINDWKSGTSSLLILTSLLILLGYWYLRWKKNSKKDNKSQSFLKNEFVGYKKWFTVWSLAFSIFGFIFIYNHDLTTLILWLISSGVFYFLSRNKYLINGKVKVILSSVLSLIVAIVCVFPLDLLRYERTMKENTKDLAWESIKDINGGDYASIDNARKILFINIQEIDKVVPPESIVERVTGKRVRHYIESKENLIDSYVKFYNSDYWKLWYEASDLFLEIRALEDESEQLNRELSEIKYANNRSSYIINRTYDINHEIEDKKRELEEAIKTADIIYYEFTESFDQKFIEFGEF